MSAPGRNLLPGNKLPGRSPKVLGENHLTCYLYRLTEPPSGTSTDRTGTRDGYALEE